MTKLPHELIHESRRIDQVRLRSLRALGRVSGDGSVILNDGLHRLVTYDAPVNGGVYINSGMLSAAIDIDASGDPALDDMYKRFQPVFERVSDISRTAEGLLGLAALVATQVLYDGSRIDTLNRDDGYLFADKSIQKVRRLGEFVAAGVGICSHQALVVTALLERAVDEALVPGTVKFLETHSAKVGPHAYASYEDDNNAWIIDPAQMGRHDKLIRIGDRSLDMYGAA